VRVALDTSTEVGNRCARVLLGEASVSYLGVMNGTVPSRHRSGPISDLSGFDVLVSDGTSDIHSLIGRASVADVPVVLWSDEAGVGKGSTRVPIVYGANVATALTAALRSHPAAEIDAEDVVRVSWTEPGKPHRSGIAITFPEPVGNQWGKKRGSGTFVALVEDEWAGAVVDIEGPRGRRIVGVSDHGAYMEATVLAATALAVATTTLEPKLTPANVIAADVLDRLADVELEVAVWRSSDDI
jgi:hypothetical protein